MQLFMDFYQELNSFKALCLIPRHIKKLCSTQKGKVE